MGAGGVVLRGVLKTRNLQILLYAQSARNARKELSTHVLDTQDICDEMHHCLYSQAYGANLSISRHCGVDYSYSEAEESARFS